MDSTEGSDEKKRPNIIMIPIVFMGHTPIFIHLIHQLSLKYAGHATVTVISAVEVTSQFSALQEKGIFGDLDLRFITMFTPIDDCVTDDPKLPVLLDNTCNKWRREFEPFRLKVLEQKRLGLETELGHTPNCIIADCFLHFSKDFSDDLGIPWIPVYTLPMWLGLSFIYSPKIRVHPRHSTGKIDVAGLEKFRISDPPYEVWNTIEFVEEHRICAEQSGAILVNSPEHLEVEVGAITEFRSHLQRKCPPGKEPPVIYTVGPKCEIPGFGIDFRSKLSASKSADERCFEWLDKQKAKSVLYIAFGTLANLTPQETTQVGMGLESSGVTFLWNLKVPATSTIEEMLPAGFLERTSDHGYLLRGWAPQVQILQHPALGGFMTHCGWNSTCEAICSGIPLISSPCFADQCMNARVISEVWKIGVPTTPGYKHDGYEIKGEDVEKAVKTLMFDDIGHEMRKRAEDVKKSLVQEVSEGGVSYKMTEDFLKYITTV